MNPSDSKWQSVGRWLLYVLLFITPFSIAAIEVLFPVWLIVWGIGWHWPGRAGGVSTPPHEPAGLARNLLLLYTLACFISIFYSDFPKLSLRAFIGKTAEYTLLFLIASEVARHPSCLSRVLKAITLSAWFVVLYALLQEVWIRSPSNCLPFDPFRRMQLNYLRMVGPYKNPNDLATFLMVTSLMIFGQLLEPSRKFPKSRVLLCFLLIACLTWTKTMGALLGFFAGLCLLLVLHFQQRSSWKIVFWTVAGVIGLSWAIEPSMIHVLTLSDLSSQERVSMWSTAIRMIREAPLFGHGFNTFMANYQRYALNPNDWPAYAHNCYLQITAETGSIGMAIFFSFLVFLFRAYWRSLASLTRNRFVLSGIMAGLLAFLVQSAFDTNFYVVRQAVLFWTLSGVLLGMLRVVPQTD